MATVSAKMSNNGFSILFVIFFFFLCPFVSATQTSSDAQIGAVMVEFNKLLLNANTKDALRLIKKEERRVVNQKSDGLAQINFLYSKYYFFIEDLEQAKIYAEKSLEAGKKGTSTIEKAFGHYAMANSYYQFNMLALSYKSLNQSLKFLELEPNPYLLHLIHYKLYSINTNWDSAVETNIHAQRALEYAMQIKDYDAISNSYSAKVFAMKNMYGKTKNLLYNDSVLYFLKKSATLDEKYPKRISMRTNAISNINLADYYFQSFNKGEISYKIANDSISKYLKKVENIPSSLDQNFELRASSLGMKAQLALAENDYKKAENYLLSAFVNLQLEKKRPAYYTLFNITIGLHTLYKSQQDYKKAYHFLGVNQAFKDSIFNEKKINEVHSLKTKYENEKIKEKNEFLENRSILQNRQNYLLIAICLLILLTLLLTYKNYKKKMALQKNIALVLEKQNGESKAQVILEKEKQARLSAERKILKLENDQMQKEAMVNILQIDRKNELLENVRKELTNSYQNTELQKSLKNEQKIEKSLNEAVKVFGDINPSFFIQLKEQSNNSLTALDLKYCAYFHLGLSAKEISQIFNVEPKSIRMTKYRVKQKLNLAKESTLEAYFESLER